MGQGPAQLAQEGGADSPSLPLKAASFSGRFSSSLYFWSHRNSLKGERTVLSTGSMGRTHRHGGPSPWWLVPRQVSELGQTGQEALVFV